MPTATPPTDPDSLAILHAISREDLSAEDTYNAVEGLRNMAGRSIAATIESMNIRSEATLTAMNARFEAAIESMNARFEAAIESMNARFEAKLDAQNAKLDALRWLIGGGFAVLGILVGLLRLLD